MSIPPLKFVNHSISNISHSPLGPPPTISVQSNPLNSASPSPTNSVHSHPLNSASPTPTNSVHSNPFKSASCHTPQIPSNISPTPLNPVNSANPAPSFSDISLSPQISHSATTNTDSTPILPFTTPTMLNM